MIHIIHKKNLFAIEYVYHDKTLIEIRGLNIGQLKVAIITEVIMIFFSL